MNHLLAEELFSQLQGAPLQQISRQLGTDPQQTTSAIGAALPMLLGALGRNAAQPQGADALFGALQRDHAGTDLGSVLGSMLGAGGSRDGEQILGHIFGNRTQRAENSLGQASGLGSGNAGNLLKMLAPLVLTFLAQRYAGGGGNPGDLGSALAAERDQVNRQGGGILDSLLDSDGDGQMDLGGLMKIGGSLLGGGRF